MLLPIFKQYNVKSTVLFGSYSKAKAGEKSDIDLLLDSGLRFIGLSEDIRQLLDKEVDVFDITLIEPHSRIDREIQDTGVLLYEKCRV